MKLPDSRWTLFTFCFPHSTCCSFILGNSRMAMCMRQPEFHGLWKTSMPTRGPTRRNPSTGFADTESSPLFSICYPPSGAPALTRSLTSFCEAAHAPPITSQPLPSPPPFTPPLPLHLPLWTAGSQCVILFIPCFFPPLLSPLHPSIPFFYLCSAVKPSWIRPASLVTCTLCWLGKQVGQKRSWLHLRKGLLKAFAVGCMKMRLYVMNLFIVFNTKDQICKIHWQKAESNVHAYFHRYLDVWNIYK